MKSGDYDTIYPHMHAQGCECHSCLAQRAAREAVGLMLRPVAQELESVKRELGEQVRINGNLRAKIYEAEESVRAERAKLVEPIPDIAVLDKPRIGWEERGEAAVRVARAVSEDRLTVVESTAREREIAKALTQAELDKLVADLPRLPTGRAPVDWNHHEGIVNQLTAANTRITHLKMINNSAFVMVGLLSIILLLAAMGVLH